MSGNFVQRGAPAIIDKYTRTKMALEGGADLVLELPVPFATAAAPIFASAGVSLLTRLGCVDALCFGSESGNIDSLITAARTLQEEPPEYKSLLQCFLKEGNSYPKSVQLAMNSMGTFLTASPNDTLGIEYIKALLASGSTMKPFAVKREAMTTTIQNSPQVLQVRLPSEVKLNVKQLLLFRHFQLFFLRPPFL